MTREGCGQPGPHLSVAHTLQHIITGGRGGVRGGVGGWGGQCFGLTTPHTIKQSDT